MSLLIGILLTLGGLLELVGDLYNHIYSSIRTTTYYVRMRIMAKIEHYSFGVHFIIG